MDAVLGGLIAIRWGCGRRGWLVGQGGTVCGGRVGAWEGGCMWDGFTFWFFELLRILKLFYVQVNLSWSEVLFYLIFSSNSRAPISLASVSLRIAQLRTMLL